VIVACISDTHGRAFEIPPCDVFIHAGDITAGGTIPETAMFAQWLSRQTQAKYKLLVPGNHDACFQDHTSLVRDEFAGIATILIDEKITIDGISFHGSPWTPPFRRWWFMADEDKLHFKYMMIPNRLDILITHGPPRGILDPGWQEDHVGSEALLEAVRNRKIRHHLFGHLHDAGGKSMSQHGIEFHNLSAVDEAYNLVRQPLVLEI
jgi:Icc-related predicted phosphoesterase